MRRILRWTAALAFGVAVAAGARAHSLDELQTTLAEKEQYFQPLDTAAPDFALQKADGSPFGLADLHGKVVVLNFIYATCPDVCPLHAEKIAEVQTLVNQTPMKEQVEFVSVTTDPASDTPEVMRDYGPAHGLDPANWVFLTTSDVQAENATRKLAEAFGHTFTKAEGGYQTHGVVTHVIDKQGRWRANFHGLKFEAVNLVLFVNALVNDVARTHGHGEKGWWERVRELFL